MSDLNWTDSLDVAELLIEQHPDVDPTTIRFTDLQRWVLDLPGFIGTVDRCNERLLEAIQMAWIDERD